MRRPRHRVTEDLVIDTAVPGDVKIEKDKRDKYQELSERERACGSDRGKREEMKWNKE